MSAECPYNVTGFSFAGMIGVIIGHSDRIAWGVTNVQSDALAPSKLGYAIPQINRAQN